MRGIRVASRPMRLHVLLVLVLFVYPVAQAQSPGSNPMQRATGTFDVKVAPLGNAIQDDATIGRFSLEKQFQGALTGTSKGEMLSSGDPKNDAGAVAVEKVSGQLEGRSGTFVLQHHGIMAGGKPQHWTITVVPGSGTGDLKGLTGTMQIIIEGGKHSYVLEYSLPKK